MEKFNSTIQVRLGLICFGAVILLGSIMYIFYEVIASSFWYYALNRFMLIDLCDIHGRMEWS
jgi:hypothetical protein